MVKRAVLETDRMRVNYKTALTAIGFEANPWIGVYF
jgi:hypothetical protein